MILSQTNNQLSVDIASNIKTLYNIYEIYVNDVLVGSTLPFVTTIATGITELKVILKNVSSSYVEQRCYLYDPTLQCQLTKYVVDLDKQQRLTDDILYAYYLLLEGTKENTSCTCFCDDLKKLYTEITDKINCDNCNC